MTEQEWQECTDPDKMLAFLRINLTHRKYRLFDFASCRRIWSLLTPEGRALIEILERFADGLASVQEVEETLAKQNDFSDTSDVSYCSAADLAAIAADDNIADSPMGDTIFHQECREQCKLLRCIFGNPFRPVAADPSWLTPDVVALAQAIYDERRFADLPILADALEEAGCNSAELLEHCRSDGPHTRGCWAVDLLLGKE